jgi:hypothetical protein
MKPDLTSSVLTFVLGVSAVAGVVFALQTIFLMRDFRSLSVQATIANNSLAQAQALANDVGIYNKKSPSPELTKILQAVQAKPAVH